MISFDKQYNYFSTILMILLLASMGKCHIGFYEVSNSQPCNNGFYKVARTNFIDGKPTTSHYCYKNISRCEKYDVRTNGCLKCARSMIFG